MSGLESPYDWLRYANAGSTRNRPLSNEVLQAFERFVPDMGITLQVESGGQTASRDPALRRVPGGWTGSTRHNHGNAGDVSLYIGDRRLDATNEEDRAIMAQFITNARRNRLEGIGYGPDYMGTDLIHVGLGNPAFWSSTQSGRPRVPWAYEAWQAGAQPVEYSMGTSRPRAGGSFREALTMSESTNNTNAYNDEEGAGGHRGHGGLLQFGTARLADAARAGVIPRMTAAEFARQPREVQDRVGDWHFQDIDAQISNMGLDQYYGQTVGGVPVDHEAITAMAHLGGINGARRFLESGGEYNPADAYGTRLSDYGQRFAGLGGPTDRAGADGAARSLDFDSVLSSDMLRRNSDPNGMENTTLAYSNALFDRYDSAVRNQEDLLGYMQSSTALTFGTLMPDIKDTPEYAQLYSPGAPIPTGDDTLRGSGGDDTLRGGFSVDEVAPEAAAAPPTPDQVAVAARNGNYDMGQPVAAPDRRAEMQRYAEQATEQVREALPNQGGGEKDWAGFLQALGVGFGQMAGGENVNIGGVMQQRLQNRMAQEAAELEQIRYDQEQERLLRQEAMQERQFTLQTAQHELDVAREARVSRMEDERLLIERDRLAFDREEAGADEPVDLDFSILAPLAENDPGLASVIGAAQEAQEGGNYATRDLLMDAVGDGLESLQAGDTARIQFGEDFDTRVATMARSAGSLDPDIANAGYQEALSGLDADDPAASEKLDALNDVWDRMRRPENQTQIQTSLNRFMAQNPDATDEEITAEEERLYQLAGGHTTREMWDEELARGIAQRGYEKQQDSIFAYNEEMLGRQEQAATNSTTLNQAMRAINQIAADPNANLSGMTGNIAGVINATDTFLQGFVPQGTSVGQYLADEGYITNIEAWERLDGASLMLGLLMTRQLMTGQGSVTDEERRNLLNALLSSDRSISTVKAMGEQLQALNNVDLAMADYWTSRHPSEPVTIDEIAAANETRRTLATLNQVAKSTVVPAAVAQTDLELLYGPELSQTDGDGNRVPPSYETVKSYTDATIGNLPILDRDTADFYYDSLVVLPRAPTDTLPRNVLPRLFVDRATYEQEGTTRADSLYIVYPDGRPEPYSYRQLMPTRTEYNRRIGQGG